MTFPESILDRVVQAFIGGAWTVVTPYVYERDPITITRGAGAERSQTQHSRMTLTLDNRDGRWSPRNPAGAWFGSLPRRNLLIACGVRLGECFLLMGGTAPNYLTAPDSAGLSVTGDLDVRVDVTYTSWRSLQDIAGKYTNPSQRSWAVQLQADGTLVLYWTTDGSTLKTAASTVAIPWPQTNRCTVRVTLDVNNGAGGYTVTFYYSTTPGTSGPWRQMGDPVATTSGTTSVFDSTSAVVFGSISSASSNYGEGRLHAAELRNGIDGTIVADPDVRSQARGTSSFSDGTNTWTVTGSGAAITNYRTEFVGELAEVPVERDQSGRDIYVTATAAGILRRLGQGQSALSSTLRRALPTSTALRAYWPFEDGSGADFAASAVSGGAPMRWGAPAPSLAAYDAFVGSAPIPTLNGSAPRGVVRSYTATNVVQVRLLLAVPSGGATNGAVIARISVGGTAPRWDLIYGTGGTLALTGYDSTGTSLGGLGATGFAVDGKDLLVQVELTQNGTAVDVVVSTVEPGKSVGSTASSSVASRTVTLATAVQLNPGGLLTDTAVGHVTVEDTVTSLFTFGRPLNGYSGETAGRRVERLCSEAGVTFLARGDLDDSAVMGPQGRDTLLNLLRECETTDGGILAEPRDRLGLTYTPLSTLYSPGTRVVLDGGGGTGGDLTDYRSTDDDQLTRNDITVSRPSGSSARAVDEDGVLGTAEVGTYDDSVSVNVDIDERLPDHASWRLNLGTIDEPRFPLVEAELGRAALVADAGTTTAVIEGDLGDGLDIEAPPTSLPATTIRQVIVGRTVRLSSNQYRAAWVCQPAAGLDVAVFDYEHPDEESRYSSDGTTVDGSHTAGATTLHTETLVGPLWGHGDGDFTIRIVDTAEEMTVTGVSDTGSTTQDFTVTRGVNGTTAAALSGGETVELARPVKWGL